MRRAGLVVLLGLLCASTALANPPRRRPPRARGRPRPAATPIPDDGDSRSIGLPNRGRLVRGVGLNASATVRFVSGSADHRFGTSEFVRAIERAAAAVNTAFPGSQLGMGDLSRRTGGLARPHRSHRNGRDADIAFYVTHADGTPAPPHRFQAFGADGLPRALRVRARRGRRAVVLPPPPDLRFDDARNWAFVDALLTDAEVRVQYVFLANPLRDRLLAHAARIGAPASVVERATRAVQQPRRGSPHADHFHVRIYCDPGDRPQCTDSPPYWPWFEGPQRAGVADTAED